MFRKTFGRRRGLQIRTMILRVSGVNGTGKQVRESRNEESLDLAIM